MVSATILTLIVIPAVYSLWQEARLRHAKEQDESERVLAGPVPLPAGTTR